MCKKKRNSTDYSWIHESFNTTHCMILSVTDSVRSFMIIFMIGPTFTLSLKVLNFASLKSNRAQQNWSLEILIETNKLLQNWHHAILLSWLLDTLIEKSFFSQFILLYYTLIVYYWCDLFILIQISEEIFVQTFRVFTILLFMSGKGISCRVSLSLPPLVCVCDKACVVACVADSWEVWVLHIKHTPAPVHTISRLLAATGVL